jgi:dipeptidase D
MSNTLDSLYGTDAGSVWRHFAELCAIPRPSHHEAQVRAHLLAFARRQGWADRQDSAGNVVLSVPGRGRHAGLSPLILQGHLDMVGEKNSDTAHDFLRDPIRPRIVDGWVYATGTTLGADNGLGVALALALATADLPDRLPLELLFTVDEETGLTGALEFDAGMVTGRHLLNLDSEEDWQFIIGCAGGVDMTVDFPLVAAPTAAPPLGLAVRGLQGGHSGTQIHERRGNALRALARLLDRLRELAPGLVLYGLTGGNKKNAIPRESQATFAGVPPEVVATQAATLQAELRQSDPKATVEVLPAQPAATALPLTLIDALLRLPQGVLAMDPSFPSLVKTSNNLSVVTRHERGATLLMHGRSSSETDKNLLLRQVRELALNLGAQFAGTGSYPGWEPCPSSTLLRHGQRTYQTLFGHTADVVCIHAGLEAGILGAKLGTGELLSYGPTILNPHSPDERVEIASVAKVYRFLRAFVSENPYVLA